jgi:hypothetical protein
MIPALRVLIFWFSDGFYMLNLIARRDVFQAFGSHYY